MNISSVVRSLSANPRGKNLIASSLAILLASSVAAHAQPEGELVILQWMSGSDLDTVRALQKAFTEKYPDVTVKEIPVTWSGDPRGGLRTALLGGESADLMVNTWPSFRSELVDAGLLRPMSKSYDAMKWNDKLDSTWKDLGTVSGDLYGITFSYGDRSGLWYNKETFKKAGIENVPQDWAGLLDSIQKLNASGVTAWVIPAKFWAHAEVFETLLLRQAGADFSKKLAAHEVPWTDENVKAALRKWRELLDAGCCGDVSTMLGMEWDNAADKVLKEGTGGMFQMGMWVSNRADSIYKLDPSQYGLFQFPAMGLGHDNATSVDAKEFVSLSTGSNPETADAFIDFTLSEEGSAIIAKAGLASPSKATDTTLYLPAVQASNSFVSGAEAAFVLGDSLPGDLGDEYRVQLQRFLQDPSDANIDIVTAAIEEKAKGLY
ncbi:ABC transporter substrate-binding protein [Brucella gallinifaecis]|uniref:Extracellular solute-binding protein n=1 Tax=Brucella gallinifaecis TaxID=215590 RepID=A0A502BTA9_9HYPH|nr:extracellular solute-binding protein [Brucella gallinifaecis]TPF76901.1 extracellular solute-binding protein [Brucella gallinifaecis]